MNYNAVSHRSINAAAMNYTNKTVNSIDINTDNCRLSFASIAGVDQDTQGATGVNWQNVFVNTPGVGIYPDATVLNPNSSSKWDIATKNVPLYKGQSGIVTLFGQVVLKQADAVQDANSIQLTLWSLPAVTTAVPNPVWAMLQESATVPGTSSMMAIGLADRAHGN